MVGDSIAIVISVVVIIVGLLPPRLQLAKWREERFAPCTFGRALRLGLFGICFGLGGLAWYFVTISHRMGWWAKVVPWPVVGWMVAALGSLAYLIMYVAELWKLDAHEIDKKQLKAAASR